VLVAVILLAVVALGALAALAFVLRRSSQLIGGAALEPDEAAARALDASTRPAGAYAETRRLISIEILNPIELAGTRGWLAGLAGSLVPKITRRVVHDQVLKILKQQLDAHHVVADVRLHTLRPPAAPTEPATDSVQRIDLDRVVPEDVDDLGASSG
jgi:hypothetical protein